MARPFDLISFDFDGVLLHSDHNDQYFAICQQLGLTWPDGHDKKLLRYFHDYWGTSLYQADSYERTPAEFWQVANHRFLEVLQAQGDVAQAAAHLTTHLQTFDPLYFHESTLHDILEGLRSEGYRVVMITNRGDSVHELLTEWELENLFELVVTRHTAGKPKPDPAPFNYVLEKVGIAPHRALHIGDNPHADVVGAHNAGWHALLLDPDDLFSDWDVGRIHSLCDLANWLDQDMC